MKTGSFLVTCLAFWEYNAGIQFMTGGIKMFTFEDSMILNSKKLDRMAYRLKRDCVTSTLTVHSDLLGRET